MGTAPIDRNAIAEAVLLRLSDERCPLPGTLRLARDLAPLVSHKLSQPAWRQVLDDTVMSLARQDQLALHGQHFHATAKGAEWRNDRFGYRIPANTRWPELRDVHLVARSLGLGAQARKRKALTTGDGLRRIVLESSFGIALRASDGLAGIRDSLARLALRRGAVSGDKAVSTGSLSAPSRRAQAACLMKCGIVPANDQRLIASLAADRIGAVGTSPAALRLQLLRRYMSGEGVETTSVPVQQQPDFNIGDFVVEVRNFARHHAQGWQGNRRALISRVFPALSGAHPEWGLDVARFKELLAEAHSAGRLHLVHADLRDKKLLDDLRASAIAYRNMILHFIRVEDENIDAA